MEKYTFHEQVVNLKKFIDDTEMTSPERKLMINGMVTSLEVRYELDLSAQPEIRCKDCKRWNTVVDRNKAEYGLCQIRSQLEATKRDDFCSRAERRTDE